MWKYYNSRMYRWNSKQLQRISKLWRRLLYLYNSRMYRWNGKQLQWISKLWRWLLYIWPNRRCLWFTYCLWGEYRLKHDSDAYISANKFLKCNRWKRIFSGFNSWRLGCWFCWRLWLSTNIHSSLGRRYTNTWSRWCSCKWTHKFSIDWWVKFIWLHNANSCYLCNKWFVNSNLSRSINSSRVWGYNNSRMYRWNSK